ncbi:uncharacterized protein BX663DRAFT_556539 [Cokeromyces recurvatus]|uniref:uncharacterized protein n=1 Tax=Cokeromyces recurvatus TaxID=90255 RepID=UPI00222092A6|nr:uncharacterized protein BX663DRAFT_556539 [Cokeromyces recurvatus]KAI7897692.1 hypothetical protein BX663DRAFT_556539 [Cokeromyces recurvatus]
MSRSLNPSSFNQEELANEWEEAYHNKNTILKNSNNKISDFNNTFKHFNAIFSDDDDDDDGNDQPVTSLAHRIFQHESPMLTGYVDPLINSSTFHIYQADNALLTLKHVISEDGWKKALKHKSGVVVHIKNGKGDKTPIFKGEFVIQGFSPQAVFYVIGMRKLWDEQYEDGNLVENLNDTTSLTYEVMKPTATNKPRDLALVEKIECTRNGAIIFACTSVETPKIPRISGRARINIKLQGWVLEPLYGEIQPATKIKYIIQETIKGWVPGFAKKALARRPLVIAKISEYLEKKTERMRATHQALNKNASTLQQNMNNSRTPSATNYHTFPQQYNNPLPSPFQALTSSQPSLKVSQPSILQQPEANTSTQHSTKKHISFADNISHTLSQNQTTNEFSNDSTNSSITQKSSSVSSLTQQCHNNPLLVSSKRHLYPSHRHPIQKAESIQLLKKLTSSFENWSLLKECENGTKLFVFNSPLSVNDDNNNNNQITLSSYEVPFIRADSIIDGGWTAEQLCSVTRCFGARKIWDLSFERGQTIERFSQKEYLDQWFLGSTIPIASIDLSVITSIETDPTTGTVYTASTSVTDHQVPPDELEHRIRAYSDLYGWVFRPKHQGQSIYVSFICNMDFKYRIPKETMQSWIDTSLQSITQLHHYLTQYGCPPYIRRVAGKVQREAFDAISNHYEITYVAKHQPSHAYRARKHAVWCTDIKFHQKMFSNGLDIHVTPENGTRIEISQQQKSIKIYTMDESIDGKEITIMIDPLSTTNEGDGDNLSRSGLYSSDITYRYNGQFHYSKKEKGNTDHYPSKVPHQSIHKEKENNDNSYFPKAISRTSSQLSSTIDSEPSILEETKENKKVHREENKAKETQNEENLSSIPTGYVLVPEYQNNKVVIISDELSFNSQQLSVVLIAMVICYYFGRFTSCNSC